MVELKLRGLSEGMVEGLSEVVLRVKDLDRMQNFYGDILGLTLWRRFDDNIVFFKLSNTLGKRPQTLALFVDRWPPNVPNPKWSGLDPSRTTLHHFALSVTLSSLLKAGQLLASAEVSTVERTFAWAGWRSLMLLDPEGNTVELVAVDPSIYEPDSN